MHQWAKEIMETVKTKVNGKGLDHIEGADLEELKSWACIAKDIAEYDYYYHITEAMKESEYGEDYDEYGRKGYRQMRDAKGRYARRGYPMGYEEMGYQSGRGYEASERMRDMDRGSEGRMYYTNGYSQMRGYDEVKDAESFNKLVDDLEDDIRSAKAKMNPQDIASAKQRLMNLSNMMM